MISSWVERVGWLNVISGGLKVNTKDANYYEINMFGCKFNDKCHICGSSGWDFDPLQTHHWIWEIPRGISLFVYFLGVILVAFRLSQGLGVALAQFGADGVLLGECKRHVGKKTHANR